ncbi:MAG TPA: PIN domain-containing protein [Patescibacteria group bacterium]
MDNEIQKSIVVAVQAEKPENKRPGISPHLIGAIADEVSKTLMSRLPSMLVRKRRKKKPVKKLKIEHGIFLDTSAIIDGRIFDLIYLGLLTGVIVIPASILLELKRIADSQDTVKRERGRKGLEALEKLRKTKKMKIMTLSDAEEKIFNGHPVDEKLTKMAKMHRGKIITCDYNLEKKAAIDGVVVININALANCLKVIAVPGDSMHVKISHVGKDPSQGVGYLDDGTMIVVENGSNFVGKELDVVVSRVIQTVSGKILFAKKI